MVTISQIKKIHILKSRIGLNDDLYRDMLYSFGVGSSKNLTTTEAAIFIDILTDKAGKPQQKYDDFNYRDEDYASSSQLRMIEGLWKQVCYSQEKEEIKKSLRKFLQNKFKTDDIRFLTKTKAGKVIQALQIIIKKQRVSVG